MPAVVIGDEQPIRDALEAAGLDLKLNLIGSPAEAMGKAGTLDLIPLGLIGPGDWQYGAVSPKAGEAAYRYVEKGIALAMAGEAHAVVTGPISKEAVNLAGHHYAGHTEIFAALTGAKDYAMLLTSPTLRVIHATTHVSMRQACDRVTKERVLTVIRLAGRPWSCWVSNPRASAWPGLNAHCSEHGLFGDEEEKWIAPAVEAARAEGIGAEGPVPPDTVFVKAMAGSMTW